MRANNKKTDNGITTANNEISMAAECKSKTFDNSEIKEILFTLVTTFDATTGEFMLAGTNPVEDSAINRVSFVRLIDCLIDSVRDGNSYNILNSLSGLTKKYSADLALCVQFIERITNKNYIREIPLTDIVFKDEIINVYWKSIPVIMKKAACLLLIAVGHLTDKYFVIQCSNYNGDTCNFYGCLDSNKRSFFQGRIPGTEEMNND